MLPLTSSNAFGYAVPMPTYRAGESKMSPDVVVMFMVRSPNIERGDEVPSIVIEFPVEIEPLVATVPLRDMVVAPVDDPPLCWVIASPPFEGVEKLVWTVELPITKEFGPRYISLYRWVGSPIDAPVSVEG